MISHNKKGRKDNWIGHILGRYCLLKHVIKGKTERRKEVTGRRARRGKQLLDELKKKIGYWKLRQEALDRTRWRTRFGKGYGPVISQPMEWVNEWLVWPHRRSNYMWKVLTKPVLWGQPMADCIVERCRAPTIRMWRPNVWQRIKPYNRRSVARNRQRVG